MKILGVQLNGMKYIPMYVLTKYNKVVEVPIDMESGEEIVKVDSTLQIDNDLTHSEIIYMFEQLTSSTYVQTTDNYEHPHNMQHD